MIVEFREVLEHNKRYSIHMRAKFSRIQCNFSLHLSTGCFIRKNRAEVGGLGNHQTDSVPGNGQAYGQIPKVHHTFSKTRNRNLK